jgi:hypothetical protein
MVGISLGFAGNVFDLDMTKILSSSLSPGWSVAALNLGTYEFALLGGAPIPAGAALSFSASYSLLGSALTNGGNPWQQVFGVIYAGSPYYSGGVTSVRTPEFGSLILLGGALAGLALWGRKQKSAHSI